MKSRPQRVPRQSYDVLGLGCTAIDEILYVPRYPGADSKVEIHHRERHCGGLCATALVAAARLGGRCAYAGILGNDEGSGFVLATLEREGIDLRHVVRQDGAGPVRSTVVVDERRRTRNIFYDTTGAWGAHARLPAGAVIGSARVLLVDRFGLPGMIRAAGEARSAGVAVVADFESSGLPGLDELMALADHLILSREFACRITRTRTPPAAARKLWRDDRQAVVITGGSDGYWLLAGSADQVRHRPAFRVEARDTTGCGDVFHGAYAFGLARGWPVMERLELASAAAALKATRRGGQSGIPDLGQVRKLLQRSARRSSGESRVIGI